MFKKRSAANTLIIANVIIFILMTLTGGSTNTQNLIRFGAMYPSLVQQGQIWRLITPMFIHIGITHLLMNMIFLFSIGNLVESIYGKKNFLKIYLLSGFMGNLFSFALGGSNTVSAGASTSLYGMLGVMIGFILFHRNNAILTALGGSYISVIFVNVLYTFISPGLSILGHLGGLVGGILLSGSIPTLKSRPNNLFKKSTKTIFILLSIGLLAFGFIF